MDSYARDTDAGGTMKILTHEDPDLMNYIITDVK